MGRKKDLEGVVVCISGHPKDHKDDNRHIREQFTDENVSNWLKSRKGKLVEEVTKSTTHLICSRIAYKNKNNSKVLAARRFGCKTVTYEWLTDTFQLLDYHGRKAPANLYHPGKPRDGDAIAKLFKKREMKSVTAKKTAPAAGDATAVESNDDDAEAAEEAAEIGMKHFSIAEEKIHQKIPDEKNENEVAVAGGAQDTNDTKVSDDEKGANKAANEKSGKPIGKQAREGRSKDQEPPVDLSLYFVCKDELGLHRIEVWKPDQRNERGSRWVIKLYESKSEPKTYLWGARTHSKLSSRRCIRRFAKEASGDKEHVFKDYKAMFRQLTGISWHQRDSTPSIGPFYYLSTAACGKTIDGARNEQKSDQVGEWNERGTTGSVNVPREHRDGDGKASSKRKSNFVEERPLKVLKVTKPSAASSPAKLTDEGSKPAET